MLWMSRFGFLNNLHLQNLNFISASVISSQTSNHVSSIIISCHLHIFQSHRFKNNYMRFILSLLAFVGIVSSQQPSTDFYAVATWMAGSNLTNQLVVYGSPGIAAPSIGPSGRSQSCNVVSHSGPEKFYLFGGASTVGESTFLIIVTI